MFFFVGCFVHKDEFVYTQTGYGIFPVVFKSKQETDHVEGFPVIDLPFTIKVNKPGNHVNGQCQVNY